MINFSSSRDRRLEGTGVSLVRAERCRSAPPSSPGPLWRRWQAVADRTTDLRNEIPVSCEADKPQIEPDRMEEASQLQCGPWMVAAIAVETMDVDEHRIILAGFEALQQSAPGYDVRHRAATDDRPDRAVKMMIGNDDCSTPMRTPSRSARLSTVLSASLGPRHDGRGRIDVGAARHELASATARRDHARSALILGQTRALRQ